MTSDPRLRRRLAAAATAVFLLFAALLDSRNGFRFSRFAMFQIANRVFQLKIAVVEMQLPQTTRVEVYALSEKAVDAGGRRDWEKVAHATLSGGDLEEFKKLWLGLDFNPKYSMLCHKPAYRLEFYRGSLEEFDTTVCWSCGNITVWGAEYGFDAKAPDAQALYLKLKSACPPPAKS